MTTTGIDPRIRERRIEVQREAGRRRLRWFIVATGCLCTLGLAYLVVTSSLLDIDHIPVAGTHHVTQDEVRNAGRAHTHDPLLFVDTGAIAKRVETLPWVAHATVTRAFPGTLRIVVTEYVPKAYVRAANGVMLVAANGRVLRARENAAPAGLIEVRGLRQPPAPGNRLAPADAANVVPRLPLALAHQVVAVDVSNGGLALQLANGGSIRLGNVSELAAKASSALAVLAHLGAADFTYIDVSTPDRPVSHD